MRPFVLIAALGLVLVARPARAHDESVSSSEVEVSTREIVWRVDVGLGGLARVVSLPAAEGDLDAAGLRSAEAAIGGYLTRCLAIRANDVALAGTVSRLDPQYEPGLAGKPVLGRVIATLVFQSPRPIDEIRARVAFFAEVTSQHRALIRVRWASDLRRFVRLGPTELVLLPERRASSSWWSVAWELVQWGMHHIFVGYDHVAFLLALLLAVTRFRALLQIVTSFTVAHSVTLLLSALELVRLPSRATEVMIAASIVYVAVENVWLAGRPLRHRWLVTFAFGLVHGLGFASEIRSRLSELRGHVLVPILCFNLGVEVGQVLIVALAFPLLARLREGATVDESAARQRRVMRVGSVPILLLGLFWVLSRLVG